MVSNKKKRFTSAAGINLGAIVTNTKGIATHSIHIRGTIIRSLSTSEKLSINNNAKAEVSLKEDEAGISPGQACVFYSKNKFGDKVLGGGWIARTVNKYLST